MPLAPTAKLTNLEKSLTAWIEANLRTVAGLQVYYVDAPIGERPNEWVAVDYLLGLRTEDGRNIGPTYLGGRAHGILSLTLAKKRSSLTNIYAMAALRDAVKGWFLPGQLIPVRDYDAIGTPIISYVEVGHTSEADTDDGLTSGVLVKTLSVDITYPELYTLA